MEDVRALWSEYFHEAFMPFIVIEGLMTVVTGLLFILQKNVMSANGLPNFTNLSVEYVGAMSIFNILFGASSIVLFIGMLIYRKTARHLRQRQEATNGQQ